ncbi:hypothetical protein [Mycobacterium sp. 050134]|uniref:hypothetical protein n=1 Tax=Mycobacterium sp. 050134 TaxID=3096111 RepID=UPI002EDA76E5
MDSETREERDGDACGDRPTTTGKRRVRWGHIVAFAVLPALIVSLAGVAGWLKWKQSYARASAISRVESVQVARDSTIAMLSYKPDTVEKQLTAAESGLSGGFRDSYAKLIHDVVIPGARQQQISTVAEVPAAASVSATPDHAVVLLFINQTATVGNEAPTDTASSVRVTMDKAAGRWLISGFDPI